MPLLATIMGWLVNVLPLIWFVAVKGLPTAFKAITAAAGRAGIIGKICGVVVAVYWFIRRLPITFLKIKLGSGVLGKIFSAIRWMLNFGFRFPVVMFITLVGSQIFPGLLEKIFLLVGALCVKIGLMIFGKIMSAMEDVNNMEEITSVVGNSLDNFPPCMLDVMAYMHIVEDIGLIVSTYVLIMTWNLVTSLAFKFVR